MKYMLLLRYPPGSGPKEDTPEFDAEMDAWGAVNDELKAAGAWISAAVLQLDAAATTLRAPQSERVLTDGPFYATLEQIDPSPVATINGAVAVAHVDAPTRDSNCSRRSNTTTASPATSPCTPAGRSCSTVRATSTGPGRPRAIALTDNTRERAALERRAATLPGAAHA